MTSEIITRRKALQIGATAGLGIMCGSDLAAAATDKAPRQRVPVRFDDPIWNREANARLNAHSDGRQVFGSVSGIVCGVRENEKNKELMRFEVLSSLRVLKQPDGSYLRLCREVVFYRDLKTNKLMDEYDNPYTGEKVRVVDVANDPYNYTIAEFYPDPPSYGGLNKDQKPPKRPFLQKWSMLSDDVAALESDIHLYYPSAMQPEKWPRESPGKMTRVSEMFRYFVRVEDLEDPTLTHLPHHGVWSRITPWLPWMLMDQAPGHIVYLGNMATRDTLDRFPQDVLQRVKERYPTYLTAPTESKGPSLSSLENYARFQKPAPVKPKS